MKRRPDCGTNTWVIHLNHWINQTAPFRMLVYTKDRYCLAILFILIILYLKLFGVTNFMNILTICNGFCCLWLPLSNSFLPCSCWSLAITSASLLELENNLLFKKKLFSINKSANIIRWVSVLSVKNQIVNIFGSVAHMVSVTTITLPL